MPLWFTLSPWPVALPASVDSSGPRSSESAIEDSPPQTPRPRLPLHWDAHTFIHQSAPDSTPIRLSPKPQQLGRLPSLAGAIAHAASSSASLSVPHRHNWHAGGLTQCRHSVACPCVDAHTHITPHTAEPRHNRSKHVSDESGCTSLCSSRRTCHVTLVRHHNGGPVGKVLVVLI